MKKVHSLQLEKRVYEGAELVQKLLLPLIGADEDFPQDVQINASSCMNLYKMDLIRDNQIQFVSERYAVGEDVFFNIDCFYFANRIAVTDETGYLYFENTNSISRKYNPKRFEWTLNYYLVSSERVRKYHLTDLAGHRVERSFLMKVRVAIRHIVFSDLVKRQKMQGIREIVSHGVVQRVLQEYPVEKTIRAMRLLMRLMQKQSVAGIYYLIKLREDAEKNKIMRAVLKRIGIGR